jgi:hypothetical protein
MKKPVRNRFTETYEKEVTPARIRKFHQDLAKLKTCPEKLTFARNEKVKYLQYISAETLDVSGSTTFLNFEKGTPLFFDRIIQMEIDKLEAEFGKKRKPKKTNELIDAKALFCSLINRHINPRRKNEDNRSYCQRICKEYNLPYSDTIRRRYADELKITPRHEKQLRDKILPTIDKVIAQKIGDFILTLKAENEMKKPKIYH